MTSKTVWCEVNFRFPLSELTVRQPKEKGDPVKWANMPYRLQKEWGAPTMTVGKADDKKKKVHSIIVKGSKVLIPTSEGSAAYAKEQGEGRSDEKSKDGQDVLALL